jgi:glycosyltransferase involved in cell wall biosynthesis
MSAGRPTISFITPALNEQDNIGRMIGSIEDCFRDPATSALVSGHEIIVVDNGSTDGTRELSAAMGAKVLCSPHVSIGGLRNIGAEAALGEILVFMDADVVLTSGWKARLGDLLALLRNQPRTISGSRVTTDGSAPNSIRTWFSVRRSAPREAYINSGHMVIRKDLLLELGGFDPDLISGEDSELCQRAIDAGASISPLAGLDAIHGGTPSSLMDFFRRERWHGYGDFQNWRIFKKSRPSIIAAVNVIGLVCFSMAFLFQRTWAPLFCYVVLLLFLSTLSALHRNNFRWDHRLLVFVYMYVVYITARSLSLFDRLLRRNPARWR